MTRLLTRPIALVLSIGIVGTSSVVFIVARPIGPEPPVPSYAPATPDGQSTPAVGSTWPTAAATARPTAAPAATPAPTPAIPATSLPTPDPPGTIPSLPPLPVPTIVPTPAPLPTLPPLPTPTPCPLPTICIVLPLLDVCVCGP